MRKYNGRKKHCGAALAAAMIWSVAAICCSSAAMAVANRIFESHTWQAFLLRRENNAVQALAVAEKWFISAVKSGKLLDPSEFDLSAAPKDDPCLQIPAELQEELKRLTNHPDIKAFVTDQNYGTGYEKTADAIGIPVCRPSDIYMENDENACEKYSARRFAVVSQIPDPGSGKIFTISKQMLVLKDSGDNYHVIPLYSKKQ